MEYQYPLDYDWSNEEMITVVKFYEAIERANEKGIVKEELMDLYRKFKQIVPSKAEEKKIDKEFQEVSGYSIYRTIQKGKDTEEHKIVKM
ncbi:UPF0223 family protein [Bacillus cytotoxicus]|uniref:UPF0223 protein Bcer98_2663 n=2 Tax=Bacillus cytotoxicus TaxID=580165 RepID=Y2663_BACCN|nr:MULTISPECIES: UPF0223 family protein [Bacillus cereus group]A7GRY9.1 RecName: Full=UPF0223 protein Bcer98_2663 [Bacillus cytotoxicus NVH 391-98]ABS22897.1 protein of unknown function UPF0223 [Bacillus cytotoxicus NVH 391-98]AWC29552.1 hypothetical protein CG483_015245 [Bacillus cytotoxicus]AWC33565.1 hypothetical protein CG482_015000 [Bacillus cytotoxicus]AWC37541.1 hypothetical protein CG481_014775 [Bacillus cytotoxicus]AWC41683.1 hypothetical protein CG480_015245 [Bacillus cytotoxicus]